MTVHSPRPYSAGAGAAVRVESTTPASERFYGLGSRHSANLDLRGSTVETRKAFLISSAGYGEYFRTPAMYTFDLASSQEGARRVTIPGDRVEYFFYHGPSPKEILEEHYGATGESGDFGTKDLAVRKLSAAPSVPGSWADLRKAVYALQQESMSAMLVPAFNLAAYQLAGGALSARAAQLAAFVPVVHAGAADAAARAMLNWRARLVPYMLAYGYETRTRGIPVIHPLAMQFPRDAEPERRHSSSETSCWLYRCSGLWTVFGSTSLPGSGRTCARTRCTRVARKSRCARFPANCPCSRGTSTILPLAADVVGGPMELHYFPSLAAEFFLRGGPRRHHAGTRGSSSGVHEARKRVVERPHV